MENKESDEKACHGEAVAAEPIEIFLGGGFAHEEHDYGAAIERRERQEIEGAEEKVEGKQGKEYGEKESVGTVGLAVKEIEGAASTKGEGTDEHESKVGSGAGESHPRGTLGIAALPEGIEGGAGEADHAAVQNEKTEERENDHAVGRTANVRDRVEGDLSAESGGGIATTLGDKGVGGFVTGGGKKKDHVGDETEDEEGWSQFGHKSVRLGCSKRESKVVVFPAWRWQKVFSIGGSPLVGESSEVHYCKRCRVRTEVSRKGARTFREAKFAVC